MGLLRYCLAALVLFSHLGITVAGLNPGVIAVIVFYLLAGHVVQRLLDESALGGRQLLLAFARDRLWRILPHYFVVAALATALWALGAERHFLSTAPGLTDWLANLTIIPLNYYMYTGQDTFTLVPPAWSLGAELQYYLLAPLLWWAPAWGRYALFSASLGVFAAAQAGLLHLDYYGYRLLPGIGFVFMLGMWLQRVLAGGALPKERILLYALWGLASGYAVMLWVGGIDRPYDREVMLGLVAGLPLIAALARWRRRGGWLLWDRRAGACAYGIFLVHFPVFWAWQALSATPPDPLLALLVSTLVAILIHHFVERPLWKTFRFQWQ